MESMELEISKLRAQIDKNSSSTASHSEQVSALEAKLERAERAAGSAQRELLDLRKNVERMSEKAVKEGSERTSAETKIRSLTREAEASTKNGEEALKRVDTLEKKLAALTTLHKDSDARRQNGEREKESINREVGELRKKMAGLENENLRFKEDRDRVRRKELSGTDDDGLDELEDEERNKLESRIRDLEGELFESRKGAWRERKRELQAVREDESSTSPGGGFDEVDLSGPIGTRRQSIKGSVGLTSMLSSGFNALAGGGERGSLELMDDDDAMFDEDAFRAAHEEEAKKRIERVKEVKRGLKDWEGYRIDIVDLRMGDSNAGDIFDI